MQSVLVAAAPVSPPNCFSCGKASLLPIAVHVCPECGEPQPLGQGTDYFLVFGVEPRFSQDRVALEKRYYEISRALHPDRFTAAGFEAKNRSLERMSLVNQAYETLRNPDLLREYILSTRGVSLGKAQIPLELAEDWFEVQDFLMDEPDLAHALLEKFEEKFAAVVQREEQALSQLESELDQVGLDPAGLERLAKAVQSRSYLKSLSRDIERIKGRFK